VLVVETSDIDWIYFDDIGTPKTDAMEVVERFTLSEDNDAWIAQQPSRTLPSSRNLRISTAIGPGVRARS
jgi:hypothetical protein